MADAHELTDAQRAEVARRRTERPHAIAAAIGAPKSAVKRELRRLAAQTPGGASRAGGRARPLVALAACCALAVGAAARPTAAARFRRFPPTDGRAGHPADALDDPPLDPGSLGEAVGALLDRHAFSAWEKQRKLGDLVGDRPARLDRDAARLRFGDDLAFAVELVAVESAADETVTWAWAAPAAARFGATPGAADELRAIGGRETIPELVRATHRLGELNGGVIGALATGLLDADAYYGVAEGATNLVVVIRDPAFPRGRTDDAIRVASVIAEAIEMFPLDHATALDAYARDLGASWEERTAEGALLRLASGEAVELAFDADGTIADARPRLARARRR